MKKMILGIIIMCFSLALAAEQITLPIGEQTRVSELTLPDRSMTKDVVREAFGDPREIKDPVGTPPITAWEYQGFVVYFEQQWVLHAVVRHPDNQTAE
ncbi:hypothetical protein N9537_02525 [Porticoccaceae bacterium]|nr:hypothetical protein [Porticoccaceae bacterium]